jgi:GTP-binding protein Era
MRSKGNRVNSPDEERRDMSAVDDRKPARKKAGFVALLGRPNVGKSTLLNKLVGAKVAIVTSKPQTTRDRISGILTEERGQVVFLDTPGIHRARTALNAYMVRTAERVAGEADVAVHVVDDRGLAPGEEEKLVRGVVERVTVPRVLVVNKSDRMGREEAARLLARLTESGTYREGHLVSALSGSGLEPFLAGLFDLLPEGSAYYPEEDLSDLPMRFIAREVIREKLVESLEEELPYSVAVVIEDYKEEPEKGLVRIMAEVYVERESQKGIVIGRGGATLKKAGTLARLELERETGQRVYLNLFVKVVRDWTRNPSQLERLGYA